MSPEFGYDRLQCFVPLPGSPKPSSTEFRTTHFGGNLQLYSIEANGQLLGPGAAAQLDGNLDFYTLQELGEGKGSMWFEYTAKFLKGRCVGIKCIEIHGRLGDKLIPIWPPRMVQNPPEKP